MLTIIPRHQTKKCRWNGLTYATHVHPLTTLHPSYGTKSTGLGGPSPSNWVARPRHNQALQSMATKIRQSHILQRSIGNLAKQSGGTLLSYCQERWGWEKCWHRNVGKQLKTTCNRTSTFFLSWCLGTGFTHLSSAGPSHDLSLETRIYPIAVFWLLQGIPEWKKVSYEAG